MDELVVLVNDKNEQIGTMSKLAAHNGQTPLHRAFSCYVFNEKGEFLLTQRAKSKKVWPGVWTNSCCGHPAPGEETMDAIKRRLQYELGLTSEKIQLVIPDFRYSCEFKGIMENEICPVYIARVDTEPTPNAKEVEAYTWVSWDEFVREIGNHPQDYSYWAGKQVAQLKDMHLAL